MQFYLFIYVRSSISLTSLFTRLHYKSFILQQYTVTDQRASTTDWLLLGSQDIHLVVYVDEEAGSDWQKFVDSTKTIFQPFTEQTWCVL